MGTTQRIVPGVTGEPNWGNISRGVTSVAGTIQKEQTEEKKDEPNTKKQQQLTKRRQEQVKQTVGRLIQASGGRAAVKSGRSATLGRSGRRGAQRLSGFLSVVATGGLAAALSTVTSPLANLTGLTNDEIIRRIVAYCSDASTGMDETAANAACNHLMQHYAEQAQTPEDLERVMQGAIAANGVEFLLCEYFGFYIFEHLSQRFQEKITQDRGKAVSSATFDEIKLDIIGRVRVMGATKPISQINWHGPQGHQIIDDIFDSVLVIFQ
ncbi:hypothetical protein H7F15_01430 [Pontibacter sp. Tf4]|uniref:hypothetical protein n=1 Tax=Pontibacter sp. Tf4 TaxID=2761620 RepID=UPI001626222F|nr:hypothetical protein [Pontibacter sp. Tf4]MBB6609687.1 hypothetical protein [Pontibacter sp. Tf4]